MADTAQNALSPKRVSPQERALNFNRATRKYPQAYPNHTKSAGETLRFSLQKVRLTSKVRLLVEATLTATHASSATYTPADLAPFTLLRNLRVTTNMSYTPWLSSGIGAYMLMLQRANKNVLDIVHDAAGAPATNAHRRAWAYQGVKAASGGSANTISCLIDIPLIVNDRDPIGLILTQNQETQVDIEIDLGQASDLAPAASGYTFALGNITVTPVVETYSVPLSADAIPDLTVIKQVGEQNVATTGGRFEYLLPTGATYRRLMWYLTDASGVPVADSAFTGNFELVFQGSDIPIKLPAKVLSRMASEMLGSPLPAGMFALDFTSQGLVNYGGSRDYIDTERLTDFRLVVQHNDVLNLKVVYETLSRMGG